MDRTEQFEFEGRTYAVYSLAEPAREIAFARANREMQAQNIEDVYGAADDTETAREKAVARESLAREVKEGQFRWREPQCMAALATLAGTKLAVAHSLACPGMTVAKAAELAERVCGNGAKAAAGRWKELYTAMTRAGGFFGEADTSDSSPPPETRPKSESGS